ncbi:MAG: hypothetical protein WAM82_08100 [Thermoanaerobaculia bacterium]
MSAPAFQSALARLIVDPDFRDDVRERREVALVADLTARERERLLAVSVDRGLDITRTLHKGFRLGKLLTYLPLTRILLDRDTLAREVGEFWRRRPPVSFYFLEEALAFCDYLLERVRTGDVEACYLEEITAYERAALELQRTRPDGSAPPPQAVEFRHDPLPLIAALAHGEVPAAAAERHCWLLGTREDGRLEWSLATAE